ncbi:MAG TPA: hypothetical protein V6C78_28295 [Crinalium sp.]
MQPYRRRDCTAKDWHQEDCFTPAIAQFRETLRRDRAIFLAVQVNPVDWRH